MMYLLLDPEDGMFAIVDDPLNPTKWSLWQASPMNAVLSYITKQIITFSPFLPDAEVVAQIPEDLSYEEFCTLYPEYLI